MSAGHNIASQIGPQSAALLESVLRNPQIVQRLQMPVRVDRSYDIPYLAGYSVDGKTIYIDRHLPAQLPLRRAGRSFDPTPFLMAHEKLEKACIDIFGWKYTHSHEAATNYEKRMVLQAGMQWQEYEDAFEGYIRSDEREPLQRVPADLDTTPYVSDAGLLKRMQAAAAPPPQVSPTPPAGPPQ